MSTMFHFVHVFHHVKSTMLGASAYQSSAYSLILSIVLLALFAFVIICAIFVISNWMIFEKAGKPGWASIIPFYNYANWLGIAGKPLWWILFMIIPIVNIVFFIILARRIAGAFGKGRWFTLGIILLPFIFLPILAFGSAQYQAPASDPAPLSESGKWAFIAFFAFLLVEAPFLTGFANGFAGSDSAQPLTVIDADQQYAEDGNYVYYADVPVDGADPATFAVKDGYGIDAYHVYYDGKVLDGADPNTFVTYGSDSNFAKDATHVYSHDEVIPGADAATFTNIDGTYGKDSTTLYEDGTPIRGSVDPKTVSVIGDQYVMDDTNVYYVDDSGSSFYRAVPVTGADASTFTTAVDASDSGTNYDAQDANHYYYEGHVVKK